MVEGGEVHSPPLLPGFPYRNELRQTVHQSSHFSSFTGESLMELRAAGFVSFSQTTVWPVASVN
jgi:hypothetical protein